MIKQISRGIYTIECDICGEKVAYFYDEISPEQALKEDSWHKIDDSDDIHCAVCYKEPEKKIDFTDWSLNDLLTIANQGQHYHTRKGLINSIERKAKLHDGYDWLNDHVEVLGKYGIEVEDA